LCRNIYRFCNIESHPALTPKIHRSPSKKPRSIFHDQTNGRFDSNRQGRRNLLLDDSIIFFITCPLSRLAHCKFDESMSQPNFNMVVLLIAITDLIPKPLSSKGLQTSCQETITFFFTSTSPLYIKFLTYLSMSLRRELGHSWT